MAKDFWQQAFTIHQLRSLNTSAGVLGNLLESTPVVATSWQHTAGFPPLGPGQTVADALREGTHDYGALDVAQLLKHMLALALNGASVDPLLSVA
jgi:hypothetical protein